MRRPGQGEGGTPTIEYEFAVTKEKYWEVYRENAGTSFVTLKAIAQFWGKKNSSWPQGGYFTSISSHGTFTLDFSTYGMDFQKFTDWARLAGGDHAYHTVTGNVIYPPNTIPPNYIDKTETFRFDVIF